VFSEAGVRTGAAIARTDGIVMVLTRSAVFACLLQHPQLETLAALLGPGMRAEVILEGQADKKEAVVLLTRGTAIHRARRRPSCRSPIPRQSKAARSVVAPSWASPE
jgi:hypothetical protein